MTYWAMLASAAGKKIRPSEILPSSTLPHFVLYDACKLAEEYGGRDVLVTDSDGRKWLV